jgi:hypothetical protein
MLAVIVLPVRQRCQGFVDAHNPHTPARARPAARSFSWLGRYSAYRAGASACGRGGGPMHLFRVAVTFGRQASPWREGHRAIADKR